mmetsp:Transcript_12601/g.29905  ORF Transcript_12601/g.29905 Transcript_12601/m.29905 type:complete len:231 (+) Transcript_12601:414-1106(+)|eukprot:CAMPEP_0181404162 /NCGR_PEP_ID=MMETSP1110-20121109/4099_1 /TAXON_ID=174948 /ORGANISM="Symbiodinium sp., Strain CCMP421" /LENGTH=230 /DNA_ID=CAMNT_0023526505 /DNA_START=361 /DNA_END=1053 /DNA_ORIENTATION=+
MASLEEVWLFLLQPAVVLNLHMHKIKRTRILIAPALRSRSINLQDAHAPSPGTPKAKKAVAWGHAHFQPLSVRLVVLEAYCNSRTAEEQKSFGCPISIFTTSATAIVVVSCSAQGAFDDPSSEILIADGNELGLKLWLVSGRATRCCLLHTFQHLLTCFRLAQWQVVAAVKAHVIQQHVFLSLDMPCPTMAAFNRVLAFRSLLFPFGSFLLCHEATALPLASLTEYTSEE